LKPDIPFKKAFLRQIAMSLFLLTEIIGLLFILDLSKESDFYLWLFITIFSLYAGVVLLRKQAKIVVCPHCKTDLFNVAYGMKTGKIPFNYCPKCGKKWEEEK